MPVRLSPDLLEKTPAGRSSSLMDKTSLSPDLLAKMDAYWRAAITSRSGRFIYRTSGGF
jgi:hypothetical protein